MLPFCLCNKKILVIRHTYRPLFLTTLSFPSYDIGLRTYQHPLVLVEKKPVSLSPLVFLFKNMNYSCYNLLLS